MKFDVTKPMHWIYLSFICAIFVMLEKPITMLFQGMGLAAKAFGSVPVMLFTAGKSMTAPELGTYSIPGNIGGPNNEGVNFDDLPPGNN